MIVVGWGRQMVSFVGVVCVGAGMGIGLGLASWVGFFFEDIPSFWGNLHSVLPFLLLGIGVDDMFVMADAYAVADAELGEDKGDEDEGFFKSITSFSFADPLSVRVEKMRRTYNEAGKKLFHFPSHLFSFLLNPSNQQEDPSLLLPSHQQWLLVLESLLLFPPFLPST